MLGHFDTLKCSSANLKQDTLKHSSANLKQDTLKYSSAILKEDTLEVFQCKTDFKTVGHFEVFKCKHMFQNRILWIY